MIVRIWHGRTRRERADEYAAFLTLRAIPDYRGTEGNLDLEDQVQHYTVVARASADS